MTDEAGRVASPLTEGLGAGAETRWQYYYRVSECKAKEANDADCLCWHSEGDGPFDTARHDDTDSFLEWREAPNVEVTG